jgi:hypothetical protein
MQDASQAALLERSRGYMLFCATVDPESNLEIGSTGTKYVLVRRELLRRLWVTMRGFQRRWLTPPGKKRWRQEYGIAWACFAVYDADPLEVAWVIEGWWRLHGFRPGDADIKRVEYLIRRAYKFTDMLRAKREQERQERRDHQLETQAVRESAWAWTRIRELLDSGPKQLAELAACLQLKPDTVRKTLYRHRDEVERVTRGWYRLLTGTPEPNKDKRNVLYKPFPSILGEGVPVGVGDDNPAQKEPLRAADEASAGAKKTLETSKDNRNAIPLEDRDFYRWLERSYYTPERYWMLREDKEFYESLKETWQEETRSNLEVEALWRAQASKNPIGQSE